MAALTTLLALAIGYPLAFALWRLERPWMKRWLSLIIFSPIIVSVVVRVLRLDRAAGRSGAGELAAAELSA